MKLQVMIHLRVWFIMCINNMYIETMNLKLKFKGLEHTEEC